MSLFIVITTRVFINVSLAEMLTVTNMERMESKKQEMKNAVNLIVFQYLSTRLWFQKYMFWYIENGGCNGNVQQFIYERLMACYDIFSRIQSKETVYSI